MLRGVRPLQMGWGRVFIHAEGRKVVLVEGAEPGGYNRHVHEHNRRPVRCPTANYNTEYM